MGKTTHNPVTTKWTGSIGGFSYRVLRGKQVIAERRAQTGDRATPKQVSGRTRFKLASQFSALWYGIIVANLAKVRPDMVLARSMATSVAYGVSTIENHAAMIDLDDFENAMNSKSRQAASAGMSVHFNAVSQDIVASDGDVVTYQVVAFDEESNPTGFNTVTYISDGTSKMVDLPAIKGDAVRYDIMAFNTTLDEDTEYNGPLGDIKGDDPEEPMAKVYSVLVSALTKAKGKINGIQTGSFLVTP